eukprot:GEMP01030385.1.p1 GENE.GEMP01030385.1~~GEMP01030385.1.p1  ORF type:complete len:286 (+),score=47.89 GEMP01030385.1:566-1423(+)
MFISTSVGGFRSAMRLTVVLQLAIIYCKTRIPFPHIRSGIPRAGTLSRLASILHTIRHFVEGIGLLVSQRTICVLTLNTVVTNLFVYPMQSIVFPLMFKQMPRSEMVDELVTAFGIHREKAWMNFAALVSLGGVFGPVISTVVVHRWKHDASFACAKRAISMQIAVGVCMAYGLMIVGGSALAVGTLFVLWTAMVCSNNLFTIYLSSMAQTRCDSSELGRVMANMFTLFSLSSMAGSALFGYAAEAGLHLALVIFVVGIAARCGVLLAVNFAPTAVHTPYKTKTS